MTREFNAAGLQYPFEPATNRHAPDMEKKITDWMTRHYAFLPEKVKRKYTQTGMGHAGGCMFPRANKAQLTAICRFYIWAFTIDDTFEFATVEEIEVIRRKAQAILQGRQMVHNDELYEQLPVLRQELISMGSEVWLERFCHSLDLYFEGLKAEIPYRKTLQFPSFPEFVSIREKAVNVYPLVDFAEVITGFVLPAEILQHPNIRRLSQLTCHILSWANDYFSAHLEKGNDVLNLVLMLEHHRQYSLGEAYAEAIQVHDRDVAEFVQLRASLPDFGVYTEAVIEFVENLELMISGYMHWTLQLTERYKKGGHPSSELKHAQAVSA